MKAKIKPKPEKLEQEMYEKGGKYYLKAGDAIFCVSKVVYNLEKSKKEKQCKQTNL